MKEVKMDMEAFKFLLAREWNLGNLKGIDDILNWLDGTGNSPWERIVISIEKGEEDERI